MDKESDLSNQRPEEIRHQIEETRSSLTEKLETLEHEVKETVRGATDAVVGTVQSVRSTVECTVEAVKGTVESTLESVRRTFDVQRQVKNHPWAMVGGSIALGYLVGSVTARQRRPVNYVSGGYASADTGWSPPEPSSSDRFEEARKTLADTSREQSEGGWPQETSFLSQVAQEFAPELEQVKKLAIGVAIGLVRDAIKDAIPENLSPQVTRIVDSVTSKLGGEPVSGPVYRSGHRQPAQPNGVS
jgi:ElaB/YqjD/DUF883 family membrane-anchored ribosome-binding protein